MVGELSVLFHSAYLSFKTATDILLLNDSCTLNPLLLALKMASFFKLVLVYYMFFASSTQSMFPFDIRP